MIIKCLKFLCIPIYSLPNIDSDVKNGMNICNIDVAKSMLDDLVEYKPVVDRKFTFDILTSNGDLLLNISKELETYAKKHFKSFC